MLVDVRSVTTDTGTTVRVIGELDLATVAQFRSHVHEALHTGGPVVIDLREVALIDSVNLGVLVGASRRASDQDIELEVLPSPNVTRLFALCQVEHLFVRGDCG